MLTKLRLLAFVTSAALVAGLLVSVLGGCAVATQRQTGKLTTTAHVATEVARP